MTRKARGRLSRLDQEGRKEQLKANTDLRTLAANHTTLRRASASEMAGPCPRCGGDDRFHCTATWFFCRQCHPERGDAIDFIQWLHKVDFPTALALLGGERSSSTYAAVPASRGVPSSIRSAPTLSPPRWSPTALERLLTNAQTQLMTRAAGQAGRLYLHARGLEPATWRAFGLGFRADVPVPGSGGKLQAPAIVLPWRASGKLCAIRYRFLETQAGRKQSSHPGSRFAGHLFGGQALILGAPQVADGAFATRTLVLCEGEINAMSIWQVAQATRLDVLSLGSESQTLSPAMLESLRRWGTLLVWADKAEVAHKQATALGAHAIHSPHGQDANDLLQAGHLGGVLCTVRLKACTTRAQAERLLWDLWDAARLSGVDSGTASYIRKLAADQGKTIHLQEISPGRWQAQ